MAAMLVAQVRSMSSSEGAMHGQVMQRHALRAVMVTPDGHLLLMRVQDPTSSRTFWITPGGGIEDGEDVETGLLREIREETGATGITLGPHIWNRRHRFAWGGRTIDQRESFYLLRVERFVPEMSDAKEMMIHRGFRWWAADEIIASNEQFAPRRLGALIADLLQRGPPDSPIDVGI